MECLALLAVAVFDFFQAKENAEFTLIKKKASKTERVSKKFKDKETILLRKRRKIQLVLILISFYIYVDATGASPMYHLQRLFDGLPTPGERKRKKSRVNRK